MIDEVRWAIRRTLARLLNRATRPDVAPRLVGLADVAARAVPVPALAVVQCRLLLAATLTEERASRAVRAAAQLVRRSPVERHLQVLADSMFALWLCDRETVPATVESALDDLEHDPAVATRATLLFTERLQAAGAGTLAADVLLASARRDGGDRWDLAHDALLAIHEFSGAHDLERDGRLQNPELARFRRLSAQRRLDEARTIIAGLPHAQRSDADSSLMLASGQHGAWLSANAPQGSAIGAELSRHDALVLVGRLDEAREMANRLFDSSPTNLAVFRRIRDHARWEGLEPTPHVRELLEEHRRSFRRLTRPEDQLVRCLAEIGATDEIWEIVGPDAGRVPLSPAGLLCVAQLAYAERDFDLAEQLTSRLEVSPLHWDAAKLESRIFLERGDFDAALRSRAGTERPDDSPDEVRYHALLQLGRYGEAFAGFVPRRDKLAVTAAFGDLTAHPDRDGPVNSVFVASQGGPGDEIQVASIYPTLARTTEQLTVTCDPRLRTLLGRSLPHITFRATERLGSRPRPGFLGEHEPPRAAGALWELLTAEAASDAAGHQAVMLGRELLPLSSNDGEPQPAAPYLTADPTVRSEMRSRVASSRPTVGVVWRSEYVSTMRNVHYLTVADLEPLLSLPVDIVCLQHDANEAERSHLRHVTGDRLVFLDEYDLRDDFETMAALASELDVVVGVGTTIIELAAAVGTKTVIIQPTHFGTWRKIDSAGADYWHRTATIAGVSDPGRRGDAVASARRTVQALVG